MNILFIGANPFDPSIGGVERVTDSLAKELINRGYHIFYLCVSNNPVKTTYNLPAKTYYTQRPATIDSNNIKQDYISLQESLQIDISIIQFCQFPDFNLFIQNARKFAICCIHGHPLLYQPYIEKIIRSKIKCNSIKNIIKYIFTSIYPQYFRTQFLLLLKKQYQYLINNSNNIVVLSPRYIPLLKQKFKVSTSKVISIPNFNTNRLVEQENFNKKRVLLFVGRLCQEDKNPLDFIKIWEQLYLKNPLWKAIVVGDGPDKNLLEKYIERHNIKRIELAGSQTNVSDYYKIADILCLTSKYEGFGMVLIEAMAYNCIPISYYCSEVIEDIIDNNKTGYIIYNKDTNLFAKKIQMLIDNKILRKTLVSNIKHKIIEFDDKTIIPQWINLFKNLKS